MARHFKIIIIGRGLMGAACARYLAEMQDGVAVIGPDEPKDRANHEGVFASHYDEGRIARTIDRDPVWAKLATKSIARYRKIERESGISFFSEVGALIALPGRSRSRDMNSIIDSTRKNGVEAKTVEEIALKQQFPYFEFAPKIEGVYEPTRAGHISPRRLVAAQSCLAMKFGAEIITSTITKINDGGVSVSVETNDGEVFTADRVMVATGGFTINENLLPAKINLSVFARTVAYFEIDEVEAGALSDMPSLIYRPALDDDGIYLLPPIRYPDGRFYIKIGGDPDDLPLQTEADVRAWFRADGRMATREYLTRTICNLMPGIKVLQTQTAACVTSYSPSGYPMIGFSSSPRIAVLTAGCGAGAKSSDEIGRLGAVLMANGSLCGEEYTVDFAPSFS